MSPFLKSTAVAILLLLSVYGPAVAYTGPVRLLSVNSDVQGAVPVGDEWQAVRYQLNIRDEVFAIRVQISESPADLDLFLLDSRGDTLAFSERSDFNESLFLSRVTEPAIQTGRYTVEVAYQYDRPPVADGRRLSRVPFTIRVDAVTLEPATVVPPGATVDGRLLPARGMAMLYRIPVGDGLETLRLDISETDADIDLFLSHGRMPGNPFLADHMAQTLRSTEMIRINRSSDPPLRTGDYYVLVLDQMTVDEAADFRLSVTGGADAPAELRSLPELPVPRSSLELALLATVEVLAGSSGSSSGGGGSGCIIHESGYVLTNWHVVRADSGMPERNITIGVSMDHLRPPVELFLAEVVEFCAERDLALLRMTGNRHGDPLPGRFRFPAFTLGLETPGIGEPLQFIGYPGIGGTGSRASVTYTTGVVAGFQRTAYGYVIKTDGEINSGSSGGAALDSQFRLIGVPASIVGEDAGQLAYIVPVEAIPDGWLTHFR